MAITLTSQTVIYPSLETVAANVRMYLNDWQRGQLATPGEGKIAPDFALQSPILLTALSAAIRELYRELRNAGAPRLIRDNVQANLPANGATGPNVQTYLSAAGYFDGLTLQGSPTLPSDMLEPVELWEQQTGSGLPFVYMRQPQFGLASRNQTFALGDWEWREGRLNFVGSLNAITIRMRYYTALSQFFPPQVTVTAVSVSGTTVTFTAVNTFSAGQSVYLSGFAVNTALNGVTTSVVSATSSQFTVTLPSISNVTDMGYALPMLNYSFLFSSTFIPIADCEEAVAYKAATKISKALSGVVPYTTDLESHAVDAMFQLKNAIARRSQSIDYNRDPYTPDQRDRDRDRTLI